MKQLFTFSFLLILHFSYAQTLQDSLIAHYKLDGNAQDASGNGNHGAIYNNPTLVADRFGNPNSAYKMDGIDDIIRISNLNNGVMPATDEISASIWIKPIGMKTSHIFSQGTGCISATKDYLTMGLTYNSGFSDFYGTLYYTNPWAIFDDVHVFDGGWHHVVYTYDHGSSKLYVDGNLASSQTVTHPPNNNFVYASSTDWTIGGIHSNNCGYNAHYDGYIDDVRLYTRALSGQEVAVLAGQLSANFAVTTTSCDLNVTFTNSSTNATSYQWDFGDGNTSTQISPTHTYAASGNYTVTLTSINGTSQSTSSQTIQVSGTVVADFAFPSIVYTNTPITFTDNSTNATAWQWDFMNGLTSNVQNPTVTFTNYDLTNVTLIASSGGNCLDTIVQPINVRNNNVNTLEVLNPQDLTIMPVPANNHLNINFEFDGIKDLTVEIVNVLGQTVLKEVFVDNSNQLNTQFDVSLLPSGNYVVILSEQKDASTIGQISRQIIIQR